MKYGLIKGIAFVSDFITVPVTCRMGPPLVNKHHLVLGIEPKSQASFSHVDLPCCHTTCKMAQRYMYDRWTKYYWIHVPTVINSNQLFSDSTKV